jgi:hypothetical protein
VILNKFPAHQISRPFGGQWSALDDFAPTGRRLSLSLLGVFLRETLGATTLSFEFWRITPEDNFLYGNQQQYWVQ